MNPPATLQASAEVVPYQIVRVGKNAYASQGHFQVTLQLLDEWLKVDPDLLALGPTGTAGVRQDFLQILKRVHAFRQAAI